MNTTANLAAVAGARSIGTAANVVIRALRGNGDLAGALELLEVQASRAIAESTQGFDDGSDQEQSAEYLLAQVVAQFAIGSTLLSAEAAVSSPQRTGGLEQAVAVLDETVDGLELLSADQGFIQGFDANPGGNALDNVAAARAALDEMAQAAGDVTTAVLDKALKPIVSMVPQNFTDLVKKLDVPMMGRLAAWGLRAVRQGLDLLQRLVDAEAIERQRAVIDALLQRLGQGGDVTVLAGWFIGADGVRQLLPANGGEKTELVLDLSVLTARFVRICKFLRRIALLIAGLSTVLTVLQVALPHVAVLTAVGLVLVLGATIVLGRSSTGVIDLPGADPGVRLLFLAP